MVIGLGFIVIYFWSSIQSMVDTVWTEILWILFVGIASLGAGVVLAIFSFKRKSYAAKPQMSTQASSQTSYQTPSNKVETSSSKKQSKKKKTREPTKEEIEKARVEALEKKANEGNPKDQYNYAFYFDKRKEYEKALEWFLKAAEQGYPDAQHMVGFYYHNAKGVTQDYKIALSWYEKAEKQDYVYSIYNIGILNELGRIDKPHPKIAFSYFLRAAEKGYINAMIKVGKAYLEGNGTGRDTKAGLMWLEDAFKKGSGEAAYEISRYYYSLLNNNRNNYSARSKWFEWRTKAANLGHTEAQYEEGSGYWSRQSYYNAKKYLTLAANKGHKHAQELLKLVNQKIQSIEAEKRAAALRKQQAIAKQQVSYSSYKKQSSPSYSSSSSSSSSSTPVVDNSAELEAQRKAKEAAEALENQRRNVYHHARTEISARYYNEHSGAFGLTVYDADVDVTFIYENYYGSTKTRSTGLRFSNVEYNSVRVSDCEYRCQSYLGDY